MPKKVKWGAILITLLGVGNGIFTFKEKGYGIFCASTIKRNLFIRKTCVVYIPL